MKIRTRIILTFVLLVMLGLSGLVLWIINDLWPRYMATMEESMIDTATLLATMLETNLQGDAIQTEPLQKIFSRAQQRPLEAKIYEEIKTSVDMRVYVTDVRGIVLFDSDHGKDVGKNYYRWNDVLRTLRGQYGARATPEVRGDPTTTILYVASPIMSSGKIVGVLSVAKEASAAMRFLYWARKRIIVAALLAAVALVLLGIVSYTWITIPLQKLMNHTLAVRDGRREPLPALGRNEIGQLGETFEQMRDALEGKEYVTHYVQTLTHEMKSPLSAVRGAAELLEEDMAPAQRRRFLDNIHGELARIQDLIDRMLQLAAVESRKTLHAIERIDLHELLHEILASLSPMVSAQELQLTCEIPAGLIVKGELFLLRQAFVNVLQNAIEFSPPNGQIEIHARQDLARRAIEIEISDQGPGIPDYALPRIFERFYSLQRPGSGRKSSGLGLTIAREVLHLHGGDITLRNHSKGGAHAQIRLALEVN